MPALGGCGGLHSDPLAPGEGKRRRHPHPAGQTHRLQAAAGGGNRPRAAAIGPSRRPRGARGTRSRVLPQKTPGCSGGWSRAPRSTCGGTTWGWPPCWPRCRGSAGTPAKRQQRPPPARRRRHRRRPANRSAPSASTTGRRSTSTAGTACGTRAGGCSAPSCAATSARSAGPRRTGRTPSASAPSPAAATPPSTAARRATRPASGRLAAAPQRTPAPRSSRARTDLSPPQGVAPLCPAPPRMKRRGGAGTALSTDTSLPSSSPQLVKPGGIVPAAVWWSLQAEAT